jgi:hypothetical protein
MSINSEMDCWNPPASHSILLKALSESVYGGPFEAFYKRRDLHKRGLVDLFTGVKTTIAKESRMEKSR